MKTRPLLLLAVASCLVTGCAPKRDPKPEQLEPRVQKLEQQLEELQQRVAMLDSNLVAALRIFNKAVEQAQVLSSRQETNIAMMQKIVKQAAIDTQHLPGAFDSPTFAAPNVQTRASSPSRGVVAASDPRLSNGLPLSVYDGIRARAQKEWPRNRSMQVYIVQQDIAAYKKLH